jgi:hypothetical protein
MHRGDIKPFHTRQVAVKHCKPFKGDILTEEIVDPIMLSRFLDDLGVNNNIEVLSEIDPESTIDDSTGSTIPPAADGSTDRGSSPPPPGGDGDGHDHLPRAPRYDDPDPEIKDSPVGSENSKPGCETPGYNSDTERFIDNLDISDDDKDLLRYYCQIKDEIKEYRSFQSQRAFNDEECSEKIDNLREFLRSSDPAVRDKAEQELKQIVEDMKYIYQHETIDKFKEDYYKIAFKSDSGKEGSRAEVVSDVTSLKSEPVHADSNPVSVHEDDLSDSDHADMPELEEGDNLSHDSDLTWDDGADFADPGPDFDPPLGPGPPIINIINSPNVNVNTGPPVAARLPPRAPARPSRASGLNPPARSLKRLKTPEDQARQRNVANWLVGRSPRHGQEPPEAGDPVMTPQVTRSGRISKPVIKFDPALESQMQKELRTAIKQSLPQKSVKSKIAVSKSATVISKKSAVESEKFKTSTAKAKTVVESGPSKSKVSEVKSKNDVTEGDPLDDVSKRSTAQASAPTGANRLSDEEDNLFD